MSEQDEWAKAVAAGKRRRRRLVFGAVAAVIVTMAGYGATFALLEGAEERAEERGWEYAPRRPERTVVGLLVVPVLLGAAAFVVTFRAMGGRLSAEYERGLRGS